MYLTIIIVFEAIAIAVLIHALRMSLRYQALVREREIALREQLEESWLDGTAYRMALATEQDTLRQHLDIVLEQGKTIGNLVSSHDLLAAELGEQDKYIGLLQAEIAGVRRLLLDQAVAEADHFGVDEQLSLQLVLGDN